MNITIEQITNVEQCKTCHDLATLVWGEESACSIPQMLVHALYGGVVLLAYADNIPIGFLFSFPAYYKGKFVLWSHETAVIPQYLHLGIGTKLKLEQKRLAEQLGYKEIAWTFDPLISRNAHFNLNKLQATISDYKVNTYGIMDDLINGTMETDRFIALWPISETQVHDEAREAESFTLLDLDDTSGPIDAVSPIQMEFAHLEKQKVIETRIPLNGEEIFQLHPKIAVAWRLAFRASALQLIDAGYSVVRFQRCVNFGVYFWAFRS